jgi:hypothetical protein
LGFHIDSPYLRPACPNILSLGSPVEKFIRRTISAGTLNAMMLATAGWAIITVVARFKKRIPS